MKNFFNAMLAILFPWVVILMDDNPGGALLALVLQATVIGWIPAAIWARRIQRTRLKPASQKETQS